MDKGRGILDGHRKVLCRAQGEWSTAHHRQGNTCRSGHSRNQSCERCISVLHKLDTKRIPRLLSEKVRKSRQMRFRDKTAYVWGLGYR